MNLDVRDDAGVPRRNELVRGGVPFARGVVRRLGRIAVTAAGQGRVPCQVKQLAWWDDGSIKWAQVSFRADLPAGGRRAFRVAVLPESAPAAPAGVTVTTEGGIVTLDTGKLRASFSVTAFRLFESVSTLGADGVWQPQCAATGQGLYLGVIRKKMPRIGQHWYAPVPDGEALAFLACGPVAFAIEENGPLFTTLRFAGTFNRDGNPEGEPCGRFILRVRAFADAAELELQHTFIYTGEPTQDFTQALGLKLRAAATVDRFVFDGPTLVSGSLENGFTAVQETCDEIIIDGTRSQARPAGALAVLGPEVCFAATVRDFWRSFPKGMSAAKDGQDIALWPGACGRVLDLRRTVGDDEPGIGQSDRDASAQGLGRTHDILLVFGRSQTDGELRRRATAFNRPLVPAPAPAYMCGTGVEGHIRAMDFERFPRAEAFADLAWRWLRAAQDTFKWYGFADYGDFRTDYRRSQKVWLDSGRYGWRHAAGDIPAGLGITYLRSGNRDLLDLFLAEANHIRDVDTVHYAGAGQPHPVGTMHRRNKDHWSGVATPHYTYTRGLALAYFLTGDPRTLEVLRETAGPHHDPNMVTAFARCYEATGEETYLTGLKERIADYIGDPPKQPYHNFRFTSDYFRALAQYVRVCPDDTVARDTVVAQADFWTHPDRWDRYAYAYNFYHLYARALAYWRNPDRDKYLTYSAMALRKRLYNGPTSGYEDADFEQLDELVSTKGANLYASLEAGWFLDLYPYGLAALAEAGLTEKDIFDPETCVPHIGAVAYHATQTSLVNLAPGKGFTFLPLPAPHWLGARPLRVSDPDGAYRFEPGFAALPWGAQLTLAGVPFRLEAQERGFQVLGARPITIAIDTVCERLHVLGNVGSSASWRKGALGGVYRIVFADGSTADRPLRNLVDYEDLSMWKFSPGSTLARYIGSVRPLPRTHLNIVTLDAGGRRVQSLQLLPGDVDDGLCVLAVTAETGPGAAAAGTLYTFASNSETGGATHIGVRPYAPGTGAGWSGPRAASEFGAKIGRGAAFIVDGLEPGHYRVTAALRTGSAQAGGLLDILAGGRRIQGAAVAANTDDALSFVTNSPGGRLAIGFYPNPVDLGGTWYVREVRVEPTTDPLRAESFEDKIADLRLLKSLSFGAAASSEQGCWYGYHFHAAKAAIDGRFDTAFGLPSSVREVQLVLTFTKPVTANAARLLVGQHIDGEIEQFDLVLEGMRAGKWEVVSPRPEMLEPYDFVYRFAPFTTAQFRLNIVDRRQTCVDLRLIREFQLFDTGAPSD